MDAWEQRLQISTYDIQREVLPNMGASLPAGEFVSVEMESIALSQTTGTTVAVVLDRDCGVDYMIHDSDTGLTTTLATRVSYSTEPAFATFTVGERELAKRRRELEAAEAIGPYYTVQGTITAPQTGTFVFGAVVVTRDLITFIDDFPGRVRQRRNSTSGKAFIAVAVSDLRDQGLWVGVNVAPNAGPILGWP